jgi:hypothetical protein
METSTLVQMMVCNQISMNKSLSDFLYVAIRTYLGHLSDGAKAM